MPNWCNNYVEVTGKVSELEKYKLLQTFSLQNIRPMPEELVDTVSPGDSPNWYDWCLANWGTKWDVDVHGDGQTVARSGLDTITIAYGFSSAWSPPIELYQYMETLGLQVNAAYYEPGIAFYGTFKDGEEETTDFAHQSEIPEGICELFGIYDEEEYENA